MARKTTGTIRLSAKGLRFGIVAARFNAPVTDRLLAGALRTLIRQGASRGGIAVVRVPGAFEIPIALRRFARRGRFDALIALGAVIRGGTPHFEYVAGEAACGVMQVMLESGIPVAFGILTTNNGKQALERAGGRRGNKGEEAALTAIEMARLMKGR